MKKIIFSIILMIAALSQAQVIISEQADPVPTNSSVLLEFGNQPKGIILPSVPEATGAVAGTFIVNTTAKAVQYFDGTDWIDLTIPDNLVENPFINDGAADIGQGVIIGAESSAKPGVLVLESTDKAMVLPRVADPQLNILSPVAGTMVYDITSDALAVYDGVEWSYWAAKQDPSDVLPATITLGQNRRYWIASVYDTDYLPYTAPTTAASTAVVNADGTPETVTVDVQGNITTTGITVQIPVANVTGNGTVGAWASTFVVPAMYAEDGQARTLELSWTSQSYTTSSKYITATIKSLGGTFNAKKLDINAGIGNDYLGLLLGAFQYPYNSTGALTKYEVRDIPGIPDKLFGLADNTPASGQRHNFLYLPVQGEDGNIWLNNNLGANYSNLNSPVFNLTQQATSATDYNAYGSLFQWGRKPDGHELTNYTNATTATLANGTTGTKADIPAHSNVIIVPNSGNLDWRITSDSSLWAVESSTNNPCPYGFTVPTKTQYDAYIIAASMTNAQTAADSSLKLTLAGQRINNNWGSSSTGSYYGVGVDGNYWTSTAMVFGVWQVSHAMYISSTSVLFNSSGSQRYPSQSVRCIKN